MASAEPNMPRQSSKSPVSPNNTDDNSFFGCSCLACLVADPARVVFTPTIQYLPLALSGVIHCHIESHPPFQFITWTKDKRIFDPFDMDEITTLTNGSLLINRVSLGQK